MVVNDKCPCGRDKLYADCCARPHQNLVFAETAEDLMRSRYTAFVKGMGDYLMKSHHSRTKVNINKQELIDWARSVEWLGLEIIRTSKGGKDDREGLVEFKAHFKEGRKRRVLHQHAKFSREFGCWVYESVV